MVLVDGNKASQLSAILDIVRARQASVAGVLVIVGSEAKVRELVKAKLGSDTKVLTLTRYCDAQDQQCEGDKEPVPPKGNGRP